MTRTAVLMSIKPQYADLIFSGHKTIELRRVCPKLVEGDLVLVYASGPRMALIGGFEVAEILSETPAAMFRQHHSELGVTKEAFDAYFAGSSKAFGIKIAKTWALGQEAELKTLRRKVKGFHPPQSYRYLRGGELAVILPLGSN